MVGFILFYFLGYRLLEDTTHLRYHVIHVRMDDLIPFCEYFIVPYLLWFPYMLLNCVYLFVADRKTYHKVCGMLCFGMTLFLVVSALFPNIQYLRPDVMPRDNMFTRMILRLYHTDTPTNICPSIHVFNTVVVMVGFHRCETKLAGMRWFKLWINLLGTLIVMSTMFIKQHSVFDVLFAFACVAFAYVAAYHPERLPFYSRRRQKRATELI